MLSGGALSSMSQMYMRNSDYGVSSALARRQMGSTKYRRCSEYAEPGWPKVDVRAYHALAVGGDAFCQDGPTQLVQALFQSRGGALEQKRVKIWHGASIVVVLLEYQRVLAYVVEGLFGRRALGSRDGLARHAHLTCSKLDRTSIPCTPAYNPRNREPTRLQDGCATLRCALEQTRSIVSPRTGFQAQQHRVLAGPRLLPTRLHIRYLCRE